MTVMPDPRPCRRKSTRALLPPDSAALDHLRVIRAHTGFDLFDYILVNRRPIDEDAAQLYRSRGSEPVVAEPLLRYAGNAHVVECDLAIEWGGRKIRHHPQSLARAIRALVAAGKTRSTDSN